jgi:hypothetical protein
LHLLTPDEYVLMRILHKNHIKDKELLSANLTVVALMGGHLPSPQGLQIAWTWDQASKDHSPAILA